MNTGAGVNMNWFWKNWFMDDGVPDLGITKVTNDKKAWSVTVTRVGSKPVPIDLTVIYADNSTQAIHQSIKAWATGDKDFVIKFTAKDKVSKIVLGGNLVPDSNKENNVWEAK